MLRGWLSRTVTARTLPWWSWHFEGVGSSTCCNCTAAAWFSCQPGKDSGCGKVRMRDEKETVCQREAMCVQMARCDSYLCVWHGVGRAGCEGARGGGCAIAAPASCPARQAGFARLARPMCVCATAGCAQGKPCCTHFARVPLLAPSCVCCH